jgi:mRNA interferase RelE/StbE
VYRLELSDKAVAALRSLSNKVQRQIADKLDRIKAAPSACNAKPLHGTQRGLYRVRSGDYRIVFVVDDPAKIVRIIGIFDRKDGYD